MSDTQALLAQCHELGAELIPTPRGTLKVKSPSPLPEALRHVLKERKAEVIRLLEQKTPSVAPGNRDFLSRPLGQENNPDVWDAWTPFMCWLLEHHPPAYYAICDAEDALRSLERQGIISGPEYDAARRQLQRHFKDGRALKYAAECHVWWQ